MMSFVRLFVFVSIFFSLTQLHASNYDDDVLTIYAKIIPRFILMSSQKEQLRERIDICLVSEEIDEKFVDSLAQKIDDDYPHGIKNYKINFIKTRYAQKEVCQEAPLAFLFNTEKNNLRSFVTFAKEQKILTIAYDDKTLKDGVDISLFLGRKIVPYLNMRTILGKKIELDNILLRISKLYSNMDGSDE